MAKTEKRKKKSKTAKSKNRDSSRWKLNVFMRSSYRYDLTVIVLFSFVVVVLFKEFIFSDKMLFGTDTVAAGVMFRSFYANFVRQFHRLPLWNPYLFGGMPFVDAMHGDTFYPLAFLKFFLPIHRALGYKLILSVLLAGIAMYYYLKSLGIDRKVAFITGLAYLLTVDMVSLVYGGHDSKIYLMSLLPIIYLFLEKCLTAGRFLNFVMLGGSVGLLILTSHMQLAYYIMWTVGLYFLYYVVRYITERKGRRFIAKLVIFFVLAMFVGISLGLIQLMSPYLYLGQFSKRAGAERSTYEWATSWSIHEEEVASLAVPEFVHFFDSYWGKNYFRINASYTGMVVLLFALLAIFFFRDRRAIIFSLLALLMLINALGATTPIYKFFYYLIPGVKKFRAAGMSITVFSFLMVIISGIGLSYVNSDFFAKNPAKKGRLIKGLTVGIGIFGGLALIVLVAGNQVLSLWKAIFYSNISGDKAQIMRANLPNLQKGMFISFAFLALSGWLFVARLRNRVSARIFILALVPLVVIDLWRIDTKFIKVVNFQDYFRKDGAIEFIQRDKERLFRCFPLPGTYPHNYLALHRIEEIAGHHGNELRWYDEFIGGNNLSNLENPNILDLLNVKYLLSQKEITHPKFKKAFEGDRVKVYRNLTYLPKAFVTHNYLVMSSSKEILNKLKEHGFDYRNTVILDEHPSNPFVPPDSLVTGSMAKIVDYEIDKFKVEVDMKEPGFLVISDNYYPAWKAYVGGKKTKVYKADYTLRAVWLEKGQHKVEFVFDSSYLKLGATISFLSFLFVLGAIIYWLMNCRKLTSKR